MSISFQLIYDPKLNQEVLNVILNAIEKEFSIKISEKKHLAILKQFYNPFRNQYNGQKLLNKAIDEMNLRFFVWLLDDDIYVPTRKFVFGLGIKYFGGLVSFNRLSSIEMKIKETIHECGHIFGLSHCENYCVMQFSINLEEAEKKPSVLCDNCRITLEDMKKEILNKTKNK